MSPSWSMSRLIAVAVLAVFTVAGCAGGGGSAAPTTEPKPKVSVLVLATPTGAPLTVKTAAVKYTAIVAAHDKAAKALDNARNEQQPASQVRKVVAELIKATDEMVIQLAAVSWPEAVKTPMRLFINVVMGNRQAWSDTAHSTYDVDFWLALDDAFGRCVGDAAATVNKALGIPVGKGCQSVRL